MSALVTVGLGKRLGGRHVLDRVDLRIDSPCTLAVSGENGAGKSTLLRVVGGVLEPDAGEITIAGCSLSRQRVRALLRVGYAPESSDLPPHLTVGELLALVAALKRAPPLAAATCERLGIPTLLDTPLGVLSLGQRRRASIAAALTGDPALLLLDEPTNGLDAESLAALVAALEAHQHAGRAALVATHDRAFIARVATAEVVLRAGRASYP